jgi:hypothetical protein
MRAHQGSENLLEREFVSLRIVREYALLLRRCIQLESFVALRGDSKVWTKRSLQIACIEFKNLLATHRLYLEKEVGRVVST